MARLFSYMLFLSGIYVVVDTYLCPSQCSCANLSIKCEGQGLKELPFEIQPDVTALYLSRNNFTNDVLGKIKLFKNLTVIDLSYNNITALKNYNFPARIQELYLDNNRIADMEEDSFGGNEDSLTRLSLRNNQISSKISVLIFFYHKKLEYLDLSNNNFTSIVDSTVFPPSLKELNISNNLIERIYLRTFKTTSRLVSLDLRNIRMPTMQDKYFRKCRILRKLYLGGKSLSLIESNVFAHLEQLTYLEISGSNIKRVPAKIFKKCPNLIVLDLSGNHIDYLKEDLVDDDSKLSTFFFNRNRGLLKLEGKVLAQFKNITHLSLSGNNLTSFPPHLSQNLPHLKILDLSFNNITAVKPDETFDKLRVLNLSQNNIANITDDIFDRFPALLSLDLSRNKIKTLEGNWSNRYLKLFSSGNSWSCDCALKNVISNANTSFPCESSATYGSALQNDGGEMFECLICASPPRFRDKHYGEIASLIQSCDGEPANFTTTIIAAAVVAICLLAIAMIVVFILRSRKVTKADSTHDSTTEVDIHEDDRVSDYQQEQTNNGYEEVSNTTVSSNIYCSVQRKGESTRRQQNFSDGTEVVSESPYIDMNIGNDNPYNKLPMPPPPPNSNHLSTSYEAAIKTRQSSYMDFCDPQSVTKRIDSQDYENSNIRTLPRSYEKANNVYEM